MPTPALKVEGIVTPLNWVDSKAVAYTLTISDAPKSPAAWARIGDAPLHTVATKYVAGPLMATGAVNGIRWWTAVPACVVPAPPVAFVASNVPVES